MGKIGSRKYKYKPVGKMIKEIKQMAPGKKIGGQMVYPMSVTRPFGLASTFFSTIGKMGSAATRSVNKVAGAAKSKPGAFKVKTGSSTAPPPYSKLPLVQAPVTKKFTAIEKAKYLYDKGTQLRSGLGVALSVASLGSSLKKKNDDDESRKSNATVDQSSPKQNNDGIGYGRQPYTTNTKIINNYYGGGRGEKPYPTSTREGGGPYTRDMLMPQRSGTEYGKYNEGGRIYSASVG